MREPHPVDVAIALSDTYRPSLRTGAILDRCVAYMASLVRDLRLPVRPAVRLDAGAQVPEWAMARLTIGGRHVTLQALPLQDEDGVGTALCERLLHCRSWLVGPAVARRMWAGWYPDRVKDFEDARLAAAFLELCRALVDQGVMPVRAKERVRAWPAGGVPPGDVRTAVEDVLARSEEIRVRIRVSPQQHARSAGEVAPPPDDTKPRPTMQEALDLMSDGLFYELGLSYRFDALESDAELQDPWFSVCWNDVSGPTVKGLPDGRFLVNGTVDRLRSVGVDGSAAIDPVRLKGCATVGTADLAACEAAGLTAWDGTGYTVVHAGAQLRRNAGAFVTANLTELYELNLGKVFPDLVEDVRRRFDLSTRTAILRALLREEISIRDLRGICNALLAINAVTTADLQTLIVLAPNTGIHCPVEKGQTLADLGVDDYCRCVRWALRRQLSSVYAGTDNTIDVYLLSPELEERLRRADPLEKQERAGLADSIGKQATPGVLLTTWDLRHRLREAVAFDFPQLPVVAYQELMATVNVREVARIEIPAILTPDVAGDRISIISPASPAAPPQLDELPGAVTGDGLGTLPRDDRGQ